MPVDPSLVGTTTEPVHAEWNSTHAILYALGVGAGTGELAFTTENTDGVTQRVLPTFGLVIGSAIENMPNFGTFDLAKLLHASQAIEVPRELPTAGQAEVATTITGMYDKGKAAVVTTETVGTAPDGEVLFRTESSVFIVGEGGFGGDRGPSAPEPPDTSGTPDASVTYPTSVDQALLYRLSGDRNRLHSDPAFAASGGFDRPILHGLCTYGFTGRALLHELCGSDPARFRSMDARFSAPVFPGDTLTVRMWRLGSGDAAFTTSLDDGTVVLDRGRLRFDE